MRPPSNQDARIDVPSIKQHPWVLKPLPPQYAAALEELHKEQRVIDERLKSGVYHNPERDKTLEVRPGAGARGREGRSGKGKARESSNRKASVYKAVLVWLLASGYLAPSDYHRFRVMGLPRT